MEKKTVYVWIILILSAIGIVFGLFSFIQSLINIKTLIMPAFLSSPAMNIGSFVLQTAGTVLLFIFFIKLYNLSQNLIKWTNIIFGYSILGLFSSIFIIMSLFKMPIIFALKFLNPIIIIIFVIIILTIGIIWFTFVRHLRKKYEQYQNQNVHNKIDIKKLFMNILGIIFLVIIIIVIVNTNAKQKQQKEVNEINQITYDKELENIKLPQSFVIKRIGNDINEGGDATNFSETLTFIDNIVTEGESFYNIEEGSHCTSNCSHKFHCVISNEKWIDPLSNSDCSYKNTSLSPTIRSIKQDLNRDPNYSMYIQSETLDNCKQGYVCYKITEI